MIGRARRREAIQTALSLDPNAADCAHPHFREEGEDLVCEDCGAVIA